MTASHYHYSAPSTMAAGASSYPGSHPDSELAVDGGILELEDESSLSCLGAPLLLRGGDDRALHAPPPSSLMPETVVEQTPQSDGSMAVKATTITPHPNGYRDLKIEHFLVPASDAKTVDTTPGSPPPGAKYLTRVEYRVLSPGLELERPDDDASTYYTAPAGKGDAASVVSTHRRRKKQKKRNHRALCFVATVFVLVAMAVVVALARDKSKNYSPDDNAADGDDGKKETEKNSTMIDPEPNATKLMLLVPE